MHKYPKVTLFTPQNYKKYAGNPQNIQVRSSYERKTMEWLDRNNNIIKWASEELRIPYINPFDEKVHIYYPDLWFQARQPDGSIKTILAEIKPKSQTQEPQKKIRVSKQYLNEVVTYGINDAKWNAAKKFCDEHGWEFVILTEDDIFGKK